MGINSGYEYMEKGIIDGGLFFYDQVQSSALYEQVDYVLDTPTIYPLTMFCMNKEVYEGLPADLQEIIDASGAWFLEQTPAIYNTQYDEMMVKCEEYDVTVAPADDAFIAELSAAAVPAWDLWIQTANDKGMDGQGIFDSARMYIDKYNAEFSN